MTAISKSYGNSFSAGGLDLAPTGAVSCSSMSPDQVQRMMSLAVTAQTLSAGQLFAPAVREAREQVEAAKQAAQLPEGAGSQLDVQA